MLDEAANEHQLAPANVEVPLPQQLLELRDHQAREIAVGGACTSSRTATATATAPTPTPAPAPTGSLRGLCAIVALRTAILLAVTAFTKGVIDRSSLESRRLPAEGGSDL